MKGYQGRYRNAHVDAVRVYGTVIPPTATPTPTPTSTPTIDPCGGSLNAVSSSEGGAELAACQQFTATPSPTPTNTPTASPSTCAVVIVSGNTIHAFANAEGAARLGVYIEDYRYLNAGQTPAQATIDTRANQIAGHINSGIALNGNGYTSAEISQLLVVEFYLNSDLNIARVQPTYQTGITGPSEFWMYTGYGLDFASGVNCTGDVVEGYDNFKVNVFSVGTRNWSVPFEELSIHRGLVRTALAFTSLSSRNVPFDEVFNGVMLENSGTEILFIRVEQAANSTVSVQNYQYQFGLRAGQTATFDYPNIGAGNCITYQEGIITGNVLRPAAVICNGDLTDQYDGTTLTLEASPYTVVHEIGHLFDYRSSFGISAPIGAGSFVLQDCNNPPGIVMGQFQGSYTRGRRGWGTGPAQYTTGSGGAAPLVTDFQQNTDNSQIEAAADSFLNWVYRLNANNGAAAVDSCLLNPLPTPGQWSGPGNLNQEWSATPHPSFVANSLGIAGTPDASLPGDSRFFDMDVRIRQLFAVNGW